MDPVDIKPELTVLKAAVEALDGSREKNQAIQVAAREAFNKLNKGGYLQIPLDSDTNDLIQKIVKKYNEQCEDGAYTRLWGWRSSKTQNCVIKLFRKYQGFNGMKQNIASRTNEAYAEVKIGEGGATQRKITVVFHEAKQSAVSRLIGSVSTASSKGLGSGGSRWNRFYARNVFKGVLSGTFHEYYTSRIDMLKIKAIALQTEINKVGESTNKTKLMDLMIALGNVSDELAGLEDAKGWRQSDIDKEENKKQRDLVQVCIIKARNNCFLQVCGVLESHPDSYKELCSTGSVSNRLRSFDSVFRGLIQAVDDTQSLIGKAQISFNRFEGMLKGLRIKPCIEADYTNCIDAYLNAKKERNIPGKEAGYAAFKSQVKDQQFPLILF